jgi:hypothetical protein
MKQKTKRKVKLFIIVCVTISAVLAVGTLIAYARLPFLLQKYGVPLVAEHTPISKLSAKIARADLDGLRLTSLSISKNGVQGVELDGLTLSLSGVDLSKLELTGLRVHPTLSNGKFTIPGLDALFAKPTSAKQGVPAPGGERPLRLPFVAKNASIKIRRSELIFTSVEDGRKVVSKIPCSISLDRAGGSARLSAALGPMEILFRGARLKVPKLTIDGSAKFAESDAVGEVTARFSGASISMGNIQVNGVRGTLPLSFALDKGVFKLKSAKLAGCSDSGAIHVEEIVFDGARSADIALFYHRKSNGDFAISGKARSPLLGESVVVIAGECVPPSGSEGFSANLKATLKLVDFSRPLASIPALSGWKATGEMDATLSAKFARGAFGSSADVEFKNVSASNEEKGISIEKAGLDFTLSDCLALRSLPSRELTFENFKAGDFSIEKGMVEFQIESAESVLVERVVLGWCGGNVDVNAFRIFFNHPEDVDATLYCDRLNIAKLLNQAKIANAKGDGNVSGRIPVRYSNGKITVNDGFLYSTPGVGGHLTLTDFMGPLASLPSTVQLDITREALKDFDYDWVKMNLNSEGDDLLLKLSLKGAPSRRLPFTYDRQSGGLRRAKSAAEGDAGFQGISFSLNFKLPANQLMNIGEKIKTITTRKQ